jgi:hypothetical protein
VAVEAAKVAGAGAEYVAALENVVGDAVGAEAAKLGAADATEFEACATAPALLIPLPEPAFQDDH